MSKDKITEIRIEGLRTIERLTLPLSGLMVLIGENGTGKSSILEACEILRRASRRQFFSELHAIHGGLFTLLTHGASHLRLGATIEGDGPPMRYDIMLVREGTSTTIAEERLELGSDDGFEDALPMIRRTRDMASLVAPRYVHATPVNVPSDQLLLPAIAGPLAPHPAFARAHQVLERIDVHLPFEIRPAWLCKERSWPAPLREPMLIQPASSLSRLGDNLANAFHALRMEFDEAHWRATMSYVRLGLGQDIESISTRVDPGGSAIGLWLKMYNRKEQMPASALSDGELAYLAFIALYRLPTVRSVLVFDEPELHMHPGLLFRITEIFESMANDQPVLLATHSDRLLDALSDPATSVRVCELEEPNRRTAVRVIDAESLQDWRNEYLGVGQLRSAGYFNTIVKREAHDDASARDTVRSRHHLQRGSSPIPSSTESA